MAEQTRPAGLLPPWKVAELPAPPAFNLRNVLAVIGPGTIALSMSIGAGEWLLGPANVIKFGYSVLWIVTVATLVQLCMNLEFYRYTLYTGEPTAGGFMRMRPGPLFWAVVYIVLALCQCGWPAWAASSASTVFTLSRGRVPDENVAGDAGAMQWIGTASFLVTIATVAFGGKIERTLERVNKLMVIFIVTYLLVVDVFFVPFGVWAKAFAGHFHLGYLPRTAQGVDWLLLGAFAGFAANGGIGNIWTSNWIRDKGFGMGSVVGYIPSAVGGKTVKVSPTGSVFETTPENLSRWKLWWTYLHIDQSAIWAIGCFLGMYLNVILAAALIPAGTDMGKGLSPGAMQADFVARTAAERFSSPAAGHAFWHLTLLNGFWILFGTQIAVVEGFVRFATDIVWTGSARVREATGGDIRRLYYGLLVAFAVWGCVAIRLAEPIGLLKNAANVAGFILVVGGLQVLFMNRTYLPRELRGPLWLRLGVLLGVIFYGFFATMSLLNLGK